jgi:hypothetical protein
MCLKEWLTCNADDVDWYSAIRPNIFRLYNKVAKNIGFYEEVISLFNMNTFKSHFRMSPAVFEVILTHVANCLEFQKRSEENYGGQAQLNVEKTLLIAIWTLATPESYRSVSDSFNVGKSTVFDSVDVVVNHLCQIFIKWPVIENRQNVALEFARYGLPNVIGTIDRCHIPIKKPRINGNDYYNRKKHYSAVLQGICKSNLIFTDVDCRCPGSVHDPRIFRTSDIQCDPKMALFRCTTV